MNHNPLPVLLLQMNNSNLFKVPGFLGSPTGKLIPDTTILIPNYQDSTQVKLQLKWTEDVAKHYEESNLNSQKLIEG